MELLEQLTGDNRYLRHVPAAAESFIDVFGEGRGHWWLEIGLQASKRLRPPVTQVDGQVLRWLTPALENFLDETESLRRHLARCSPCRVWLFSQMAPDLSAVGLMPDSTFWLAVRAWQELDDEKLMALSASWSRITLRALVVVAHAALLLCAGLAISDPLRTGMVDIATGKLEEDTIKLNRGIQALIYGKSGDYQELRGYDGPLGQWAATHVPWVDPEEASAEYSLTFVDVLLGLLPESCLAPRPTIAYCRKIGARAASKVKPAAAVQVVPLVGEQSARGEATIGWLDWTTISRTPGWDEWRLHELHGLSQAEIARLKGISQPMVSKRIRDFLREVTNLILP